MHHFFKSHIDFCHLAEVHFIMPTNTSATGVPCKQTIPSLPQFPPPNLLQYPGSSFSICYKDDLAYATHFYFVTQEGTEFRGMSSLIGVLSRLLLLLLSAPVSAATSSEQVLQFNAQSRDGNYRSKCLRYAAFGDSWASGVNHGPPNEALEYDFPDSDKVCQCRRVNEAYPVVLASESDTSWTQGKRIDLDFRACHGAFFNDIPDQVSRLNKTHRPDFATLMIGGNDGGFPDIIFNCLLQPDKDRDYGPQYPSPDGECFKALQRADHTVHSLEFRDGILHSINAVMTEPRIAANPSFKLYVLGYAGLFNHDDPACNDWSFSIWPGKEQKLTTQLRREINGIIDTGRALYNHLINGEMKSNRVRFVDINYSFNDHRFCEPTDEGTLEAQNRKSWLYGLDWPDCVPIAAKQRRVSEIKATSTLTWPAFCRRCGDWGQLGEVQRPFHPKAAGHKAIKEMLKDVLVADQVVPRY